MSTTIRRPRGRYRADVPARIIPSPAARAWVYGIAIAAVPLLVMYGVIGEGQEALWIGLAGAVFGMGVPALAVANVNGPPEKRDD